jgi:ATP-binding cassette subfamily F protein uup
VRRQPKARSTKSKARLEAYDALASRVSRVDKPLGSVSLKGEKMQRLGSSVLTCEGITVEVGGRPLLRDFSCELVRGARIGIVGPNGAGKSTLLKALQQQLPLAAGSISCGETVVFGHYEQDGLLPSPDQRVLDIVQEAVSEAPGGGEDAAADERAASALMTRFLFPRSRWYARAEKLSGGERRRLQMLQVLARQPNVLLLDEPTNDLDLQTLAALEDFAEGFEGVLLCVSHDRYFLDRVCDQLFILPEPSEAEEGGAAVLAWTGRFSDYLEWRDETAARKAASAQAAPAAPPLPAASVPPPPAAAEPSGDSKRGKPLSAFEARSLERLEAELEARAEAQREMQARIAGFDPVKHGYTELAEWNTQLDVLCTELEQTEEKWLELAERA